MRNPLHKRILRELKDDFGKNVAVFLFLMLMVGFVSGGVVANSSMKQAYDGSFEKYNVEDGSFELADEADSSLSGILEETEVMIIENYYLEESVFKEGEKKDSGTLRIFRNRTDVNKVCLMSGEMPSGDDEIGIDRMYAENNGISVGDTVEAGGRKLKVSGFVALPDYSALFSDNSDSMFDANKFGVSVMTADGFGQYADDKIHYSYSWQYGKAPQNDKEKKEKSDELLHLLSQNAQVEKYVPEYENQAIHFAGDDVGKDKVMFLVLLYILIVIMAFVFAVTTSNTIAKEAGVIGTLRASGYTRGEIVRHYMAAPLIVTLAAALAGNVLGYTVCKDMVADLYFGSYSLTTYKTIWSGDAFLLTTIVPVLLVMSIAFLAISRKMSLPPLKFLRHDLSRARRKKAVRLPDFSFFNRFRLRIILQNLTSYMTLFAGICFANVLLLFGMMMHPLLLHYQDEVIDNKLARYQYVLNAPVETAGRTAEKYSAASLSTTFEGHEEEIMVYGIESNSAYVDLNLQNDDFYISDGFADKYNLSAGDSLTLKAPYKDREYTFKITGIYKYPASLTAFMDGQEFCDKLDYEEGYYTGYLSDEELEDIDESDIASTVTKEDLTKITRQLQSSMGSIFYLINAVAVALYMLILYLLAKVVLEKNTTAVSMVKILGYENREIRRLYLSATGIAATVSLLLSLPAANLIMGAIYKPMMVEMMTGWLPYYVSPAVYPAMFAIGLATYFAIELILYQKIRRIPMDEALKNVE